MKNTKVLIMITAHGRLPLVRICFEGIKRLKKEVEHIDFTVLIGTTDVNIYKLASKYGFEVIRAFNEPLGEKHNITLRRALELEFDYFMQLGSDDIIDSRVFDVYSEHIKANTPAFGMNKLWFFNIKTMEAKRVEVNEVFGAGRMIRRDVLMAACALREYEATQSFATRETNAFRGSKFWMNARQHAPIKRFVKETGRVQFQFWEPSRERALDFNSSRRIFDAGFTINAVDVCGVVDFKGYGNLNSYECINGEPAVSEDFEWFSNDEIDLIQKAHENISKK